jgi:hypothetical protein
MDYSFWRLKVELVSAKLRKGLRPRRTIKCFSSESAMAKDEDDGIDWIAIFEGLEVDDMETMHEDYAMSSIEDYPPAIERKNG